MVFWPEGSVHEADGQAQDATPEALGATLQMGALLVVPLLVMVSVKTIVPLSGTEPE